MNINTGTFTARELLDLLWDVQNSKTPTGQALTQEITNELDARYGRILNRRDCLEQGFADEAFSLHEYYDLAMTYTKIIRATR